MNYSNLLLLIILFFSFSSSSFSTRDLLEDTNKSSKDLEKTSADTIGFPGYGYGYESNPGYWSNPGGLDPQGHGYGSNPGGSDPQGHGYGYGYGSNPGGFNNPGEGFNFPGFGGGWGAGYGGPNGGYNHEGVVPPSVVCTDKGPCYKKKVTCPAKCFTSYSQSGKGYGGGGGGGGCTIDCKKHCVGYC